MKLWDYLNKEHGLVLLESEIHDILEIARQEISIPTIDDINAEFPIKDWTNYDIMRARHEGAEWALNKVRQPYPKTM